MDKPKKTKSAVKTARPTKAKPTEKAAKPPAPEYNGKIRSYKEDIPMRVRMLLREQRQALGLSLRLVSEKVGINYSHMHRIEVGQRGLTTTLLDTWSDALGLPRWRMRAEMLLADLTATEVDEVFSYWRDGRNSGAA